MGELGGVVHEFFMPPHFVGCAESESPCLLLVGQRSGSSGSLLVLRLDDVLHEPSRSWGELEQGGSIHRRELARNLGRGRELGRACWLVDSRSPTNSRKARIWGRE